MIKRNDITLLGDDQWATLEQLSAMVDPLVGEVAEVGVYRGGSALFWCQRFPNQQIVLIDTFEGIPNTSRVELDGHPPGDFAASYDEVKALLPANAELHKMVYPPDYGQDPLNGRMVKLLHLDVDIYWSVAKALEANWDRMVDGGVVLVDDYNATGCEGTKQALNEFADKHRIPIHIAKGASPQAWIIKGENL